MLLIEDNEDAVILLKRLLPKIWVFTVFDNTEMGLACFERGLETSEPFDLVLMDHFLNGDNGIDSLKPLRNIERKHRAHRTKVVLMSASDPEKMQKAFKNDCDTFISKPFKRELMKKKFDRLGIDIGEMKKEACS